MHASRLHIPKKIELIIAIPFANHARQTYNIIQKATVQQKSRHFDPANQVDQNKKMEHFIFSHTRRKKKKPGKETAKHMDFQCSVPGGSGAGKAVRLYSCQIWTSHFISFMHMTLG